MTPQDNRNLQKDSHTVESRIRERCLKVGIANPYQLQLAANISASVAKHLFYGNFTEISLRTLGKIMHALDCDASTLLVKREPETANEINETTNMEN